MRPIGRKMLTASYKSYAVVEHAAVGRKSEYSWDRNGIPAVSATAAGTLKRCEAANYLQEDDSTPSLSPLRKRIGQAT